MLTRNDSIILSQQVDVNKAVDLLKMFQDAGKEKIDVWTILDESAPKLKSIATLEAKLEQLAGNHACSTVFICQVIPELAQMPAPTRRCEQDLGQQPVPGSLRPAAKLDLSGDHQTSIHFHTITKRHRKRRELVEGHRRRLVLVPERRDP